MLGGVGSGPQLTGVGLLFRGCRVYAGSCCGYGCDPAGRDSAAIVRGLGVRENSGVSG